MTTVAPVVKCGVAFPTDALADPGLASASWFDVTEFLRGGIDVQGGRQRDLDLIEAGTASLTLDNSDRRFEPGFAGSPYNGGADVDLNRHLRLIAGFLAEVVQPSVGGYPTLWWRLDEGTLATAYSQMEYAGESYLGAISGADMQGAGFITGRTSFNADGVDDYIDVQQVGAGADKLDLTTTFAIAVAINPDALPGGDVGLVVRADTGDANPGQYNVLLSSAGEIKYLSGTGATVTTSGAGITATSGKHLIIVTFDNARSPKCEIWVNGVKRGTGNPDNVTVAATKSLLIARRGTTGYYDGQIGEVILWNGDYPTDAHIEDMQREFDRAHGDGHIFYGYTDGWPQAYPGNGQDSSVPLAATDAFKLLANVDLPSSVWDLEYSQLDPRAWWRLGEPQEVTTTRDSSGNAWVAVASGGTPNWTSGLVKYDENGGVTLPAGVSLKVPPGATLGGGGVLGGVQFIIDCLIQRDGNPSATQVIYDQTGNDRQVRCTLTTAGLLQFTVVLDGLLFTATTGSFTVTDGKPHLVRFHRRAVTGPTGTIKIYVDGVERGSTAVNNLTSVSGSENGTIGPFDGVLDELVLFDAFSSAVALEGAFDAAEAFALARTPWAGDLTSAVVTRLLDWAGWPATMRNIEDGATTVLDVGLDDKLLTTLQRLAVTEGTRMHMAPDGRFTFLSRDDYWTYPRNGVRATFGTDSASGELPYVDPLRLEFDDVNLVNAARFSRVDGTERVVEDATSISKRGEKTLSLELMAADEEEIVDHANWVVDQHTEVRKEGRQLTLQPAAHDSLWYQVFNRRFGDKIEVVHRPRPDEAGAAIELTVRVEAWTHSADVKAAQWKTTWQLSDAADDQPWLLGDAVYGVLGSTTKLGW